MDSANACTINSTLNTFTNIEPILIIVVIVGLLMMIGCTAKGFG